MIQKLVLAAAAAALLGLSAPAEAMPAANFAVAAPHATSPARWAIVVIEKRHHRHHHHRHHRHWFWWHRHHHHHHHHRVIARVILYR
jgi:hypothetical protein